MRESLTWDASYALARTLMARASYALARTLMARQPDADLAEVSLDMIFNWVLQFPEFDDDPELANDEILLDIYNLWLEETLEND